MWAFLLWLYHFCAISSFLVPMTHRDEESIFDAQSLPLPKGVRNEVDVCEELSMNYVDYLVAPGKGPTHLDALKLTVDDLVELI
jgi:hypothetical protein